MNLTPQVNFTQDRSTIKAIRNMRKPRTNWKFSTEFFSGEAIRGDLTDFLIFTLIGGLCFYPMILLVIAITKITNY